MPTIETWILEGHGDACKQALIEGVTAAVVAAVDAPIDSVRVLISEIPPSHFGIGGRVDASPAHPPAILQAFLIAGRSDEQKRRLIAALAQAAVAALATAPEAVRIIVRDIPNTDFGLGGKTAAALGRGIGRAAMRAS